MLLSSKSRFYPLNRLAGCLFLLLVLFLGCWLQWGDWPRPVSDLKQEKVDLILVLGGGAIERPNRATELYWQGVAGKVLVTGDGDTIYNELLRQGIPKQDILHETQANSTWENAFYCGKIKIFQEAHSIVLVTSWFHGPRALAVFQKQFPKKTFFVSAEPPRYPLNPWVREYRRRERYATFYYKLVYRISP